MSKTTPIPQKSVWYIYDVWWEGGNSWGRECKEGGAERLRLPLVGRLLPVEEEAGWRQRPGGRNAGGGESSFTNLDVGRVGPPTPTGLDGAGQAGRLVLSRPEIRGEDFSLTPD